MSSRDIICLAVRLCLGVKIQGFELYYIVIMLSSDILPPCSGNTSPQRSEALAPLFSAGISAPDETPTVSCCYRITSLGEEPMPLRDGCVSLACEDLVPRKHGAVHPGGQEHIVLWV